MATYVVGGAARQNLCVNSPDKERITPDIYDRVKIGCGGFKHDPVTSGVS